MRPQRSQAFQSDASRKLDRLELIAALLERDASHHRAWVAELSGLTPTRPRRSKRAMANWGKFAVAGIAGARATRRLAVTIVTIVTSKRLRVAVREAHDFIVDFAVVLGVAITGLVILTAALLLAAPPG
ncbi:hypothetical protein GIW81_08215 [Hyphomicrobium sp. xq]|uniref:Uncharacterized protein n=1 Tax=Hyphomicrobium album TaxID=2665159 RepID=A0A6I3KIV2_9HYPH|nr:hypothetical protein [Hyphomicrobium album]MTD94319.1 hypothetical protein [Hyphomicrobium album]